MRRSLLGVGIMRGVADLIARATSHDTQRAFLRHMLPLSPRRGRVVPSPPPATGVRCHRPPCPAGVDSPDSEGAALAAASEGIASRLRRGGRQGRTPGGRRLYATVQPGTIAERWGIVQRADCAN